MSRKIKVSSGVFVLIGAVLGGPLFAVLGLILGYFTFLHWVSLGVIIAFGPKLLYRVFDTGAEEP